MKRRLILWIKKKLHTHSPSEILTHEDLEEMAKLFLESYFEGAKRAEQGIVDQQNGKRE